MVVRAILYMILAMALLALSDAFIKASSVHASVGQVVFCIAGGGTVIYVLIALATGARLTGPEFTHWAVLTRNMGETIGGLLMVTAISRVDLSITAAVSQVSPLVVTLGAALLLKEHVGPRRWSAIAIGLIGMLLVIRPFSAAFTGWEVVAVLSVIFLSIRDLVTRLAPTTVPSVTLAAWSFGISTLPAVVVMALGPTPNWSSAALWPLSGAVLVTALGYLAITHAMRLAPASIVSPYRYTRLIFTTGLAIVFFGERPEIWTYLGAALILAAGLYSFMRERQLAQKNLNR